MICLSIHLVDSHLGHFHLLAIVTSAAVNMHVQILIGVPVFNSFEYISRDGITGSYGNSVFNFEKLPNCFP